MNGRGQVGVGARHRVAVGIVATAMALAAIGCGGTQEERSSMAGGSVDATSQGGAVVAATLPVPAPPVTEPEGETIPSADSLPPDIVAGVENTVVTPGEAVEILAVGSPDVRQVTLSDGVGKTQEFVYDLDAKAWRTYYRMPMKLRGERLGLSVTAKNDANRWRRVWLFLRTEPETAPADSGSVQTK